MICLFQVIGFGQMEILIYVYKSANIIQTPCIDADII